MSEELCSNCQHPITKHVSRGVSNLFYCEVRNCMCYYGAGGETDPKRALDTINKSKAIRIREQDKMKHRKTLRRCKARVMVGGTIYSCSLIDAHTTHEELGLVKQKGKPDIGYTITWFVSEPPRTIRSATS